MLRSGGEWERALAFVEASGDAFAIWRARALATGRTPDALVLPVGVLQRADGAIVAALDAPSADAGFDPAPALAVLGAADDTRALDLAEIERACGWFDREQAEDGSWNTSGGAEERIVATAMIAGHLGKTRFARASMLGIAGDFIAAQFTPDLVQGGNWRAIAACACYFATVPHEDSDAVLQWTGRELERGFRAQRFDGVQTARVLLYADAPSLPGGRVDALEAVTAVRAEQQSDGGWLSFDAPAPAARLVHTLDALAALARFG